MPRWLLCMLPVFFWSSLLGADEALSLTGARRLAAERNVDILSARSDLRLAEAARLTASLIPNPSLSISVGKINTDGTPARTPLGNGLLDRTYDTVISASQLLEVWGKRTGRIASADASIHATHGRLDDARRRLDAAVVKAYTAAALAKESVGIATLSAMSLRRSAEIAGDRFRAGEISAVDRDQAEIAAGRFQNDLSAARAAATQATIALELLIGAPSPDGATAIADGLGAFATQMGDVHIDINAFDAAVDRRPDVRSAAASVARAEADLGVQRALRIPDPTLQAQYERQPPDQRNTVGLGVSFSLPLFSRNQGGVAAADVALDATRRDLAFARTRARSEMEAARAARDAAVSRLRLLRESLLPKSLSVETTVAFAYEKGGASLLQLLEAERNLNDIRLAEAQALADLDSATADLAAAVSLGDEP